MPTPTPACPMARPAGVRSLGCVPRAPLCRALPSSPGRSEASGDGPSQTSPHRAREPDRAGAPTPRPPPPDPAPAPCSPLPVPPLSLLTWAGAERFLTELDCFRICSSAVAELGIGGWRTPGPAAGAGWPAWSLCPANRWGTLWSRPPPPYTQPLLPPGLATMSPERLSLWL